MNIFDNIKEPSLSLILSIFLCLFICLFVHSLELFFYSFNLLFAVCLFLLYLIPLFLSFFLSLKFLWRNFTDKTRKCWPLTAFLVQNVCRKPKNFKKPWNVFTITENNRSFGTKIFNRTDPTRMNPTVKIWWLIITTGNVLCN